MRNCFLVLAVLLSSGCASSYVPNYDYSWYKKHSESYPMRVMQVEQSKVASHCGGELKTLACAVRLDDLKQCAVLTSVHFLPKWALEHEKMHCDGWSHDKKTMLARVEN